MAKGLINKLGRGFRKGICLGATLLSLYGCPLPVPNPIPKPENQNPTALVYAQPDSGKSPLSSQLQVDGSDPDGKSDITEYELKIDRYADGSIDETISQSTPINVTREFEDNAIIYGKVRDSVGHTDSKSIEINVTPDYLNIEGYLQDNETDTGKHGLIKIYDSSGSKIGETETDSNGYFTFNSDTVKAKDLSDIIIQAQITDNSGNPESYIRTITANVNSASEPDVIIDRIRCVPYPDFDNNEVPDNVDEFKQHMYDTNCTYSKWDLENGFDKIKIFKHNGSEGDFDETQIAHIISRITDSDDVEKFVEGKELDSYIEVVDGSPSEYWEDKCIYVVPDGTPGGDGGAAGCTYTKRSMDRIIYRSRIELDPDCVRTNNPATTHEFGHAFVAPDGEATHLDTGYTIMWSTGGNLLKPGSGDEKAGQVVYENTYQSGESLENILGENWMN